MLTIDKIGIKSIKLALAVTISLLIGSLFKIGSPYLMALTSVIGIQSTIEGSLSNAKSMIIGTFIGALVGLITLKFISNDFIIMTIGVFAIIYVCNLMKLQSSIVQANIIYLSIMFFHSSNNNAISVIISTVIGVVVAIIVNLLVSPFEIIYGLNKSYYSLRQNIFHLCSKLFSDNENLELEEFNSNIMLFKSLVKAYNNEYFKMKNKELEFSQLDNLFRNIKGISFFIYTISEFGNCNLNSDNTIRVKKILNFDMKTLEYKENKNDYLFNFHVDKLLDYLEKIGDIKPVNP